MRYIGRSAAALTVLAASLLFAIHAPAGSGEICASRAAIAGPVRELPSDWAIRVRGYLQQTKAPLSPGETEELLRAVEASARRFDVDPLTILAVIQVESGFHRSAVSTAGAIGYMQLRPETARALSEILGLPWSEDVLLDTDRNVLLGTFYLRRLMDRFGNLDAALAAFNAGPTRISRRWSVTRSVPLAYPDRVWDALVELRESTRA